MHRSPRSTERRAGFTLLEVSIATALFAVVMVLALSQLVESTDVTKLAVAQADLRQTAQAALDTIARDLRSTQARYVGANATTIQLYRVTTTDPKFDLISGSPILQKDTSSLNIIYEYSQPNTATSGDLTYNFGSTLTAANRIPICKELWSSIDPTTGAAAQNPPGLTPTAGFNVSTVPAAALPGLLTANVQFPDQPTALKIQIIVRRRLGVRGANELGGPGNWYAYAVEETTVGLKPSGSY